MSYPKIPLAQQVIQLCAAKGVSHVVISPGSRNAPLTIGFASHPEIKTYSIVDERCAAFFALGMAQELQQPVAVVCTSGSALLNYYPAIAEAYYSRIPLIVISADRPKHLIDVGDGQTIRQENVFENHILYTANLKQDLGENNERFSKGKNIPSFILDKLLSISETRIEENQGFINRAINIAIEKNGPVHINVPFAEPLYENQDSFTEEITIVAPKKSTDVLDRVHFNEFIENWNSAEKRMVLIGVNTPHKIAQDFLDFLGNDSATIVFTESTSNVHHPNFFPGIDKIIAPLSDSEFSELQPDILLTIGGLIVSKKIKVFLRNRQPKAHYHLGEDKAFDTFFCLKYHFKISENSFFKELCTSSVPIESGYQTKWLSVKNIRTEKHSNYLATLPHSDFKAFEAVLNTLPDNIVLHLSNSSTIRYIQLFDSNPNIVQYCNRGTSGIDGSTSTAIGHAAVSSVQNVLITGDLSFFYDSNALWNTNIPNNFRIIIINNSGGGIFRILPGDKNTNIFETYFETTHNLTAEHLCKMYGIAYSVTSEGDSLKNELNNFFIEGNSPKLLEVFTPRTINDKLLVGYFSHLVD
ncbi:MAG: 2-succinyl-5-enolpyruvyl-6-hydroxy-3-cyclohexene-1-carboxylate synthase [Flavobacteriaceae bacterium]|nr:2-succinyl-5-enolpyruvyl-6-hydroxy-3-cyclohexene-1-carboxylate synthase [Flavobacteriaceae bacterium]